MFKISLPSLPKQIPKLTLDMQSKYTLAIVVMIATGIQIYFSLINWAGNFGGIVGSFLRVILGRGAIFVPITFFMGAIMLIRIQRHDYIPPKNEDYPKMFWGILTMLWAICGYLNLFNWVEYGNPSASEKGGGFIGFLLYPIITGFFGSYGGFVMLFFIFLGGFFLFSLMTPYDFVDKLTRLRKEPKLFWDFVPDIFEFWKTQTAKPIKEEDLKKKKEEEEKLKKKKKEEQESIIGVSVMKPIVAKEEDEESFGNPESPLKDQEDLFKDLLGAIPNIAKEEFNWQVPSFDLLAETIPNTKQTSEEKVSEVEANKQTIQSTLKEFGIEVEMKEHLIGPTVTQYSFKPASGVKLSYIENLQSNLSLELASIIRLETPIPGKSLVGLELPNRFKTVVRLKKLIANEDFTANKQSKYGDLPIVIGEDVAGENLCYSLAKMPHLLVAGSTGSGKSVWINSMLLCLLYKYSPFQLELILIDMKRVELKPYDGIPHLLAPVITDAEKAINALKWAVLEMERRYKILEEHGKRNIIDFNGYVKTLGEENDLKGEEAIKSLKYTVIVIDELGDLMMLAKNEVEPIIVRLTQMSRAVGIHLVLGTQRPDTQVVTGLIKANVPSRIGFAVATGIDSRVILDQVGAEKLLGQGDGLFMSPSTMKAVRFQGAFVEESEVKKCVLHLRESAIKFKEKHFNPSNLNLDIIEPPKSKISVPGMRSSNNSDDLEGLVDDMYEKVKEYAFTKGYVSTSALQTALGIGYPRARKFLMLMEEEGLVGPANGSKPREVFPPEDWIDT
jgi:DNA segregation ATPase FtsK/SpoIIIE, S-DNA-T family